MSIEYRATELTFSGVMFTLSLTFDNETPDHTVTSISVSAQDKEQTNLHMSGSVYSEAGDSYFSVCSPNKPYKYVKVTGQNSDLDDRDNLLQQMGDLEERNLELFAANETQAEELAECKRTIRAFLDLGREASNTHVELTD